MSRLAALGLPLLKRLDPETAHGLSLRALRYGLAGRDAAPDDAILATQAFGRRLANPIGLAAGFDKDAAALGGLARLGFGFLEAGTVTLRAQAGNPRPRLFRLEQDGAVINRMGFNNAGIDVFVRNLERVRRGGVAIGANLGINKDGADPARDYAALAARIGGLADYLTINVSSPNTPGLRDLQGEARLTEILASLRTALPVFVKVAPDLPEAGLEAVVEACVGQGVAGLIVSNTTIARPALLGAHRGEAGGLSGAPLRERSTAMLARAHKLAQGRLVLIGAGGVFSAQDAFQKIAAGASLVQLYTGFAYEGPGLIRRLKDGLAAILRGRGFASVADAVGCGA